MNIFIPYNQKYILKTYGFDGHHAAFIEDVVLRNLLKRLIKRRSNLKKNYVIRRNHEGLSYNHKVKRANYLL